MSLVSDDPPAEVMAARVLASRRNAFRFTKQESPQNFAEMSAAKQVKTLWARVTELELLLAGQYAGPWSSVVYYMTWLGTPAGLVKIGTSRNVRQRLTDLEWEGHRPELLAAEPAFAPSLEAWRHRRFAHLNVPGTGGPAAGRTELFRPSPELDQHMSQLRLDYPDWLSRAMRIVR